MVANGAVYESVVDLSVNAPGISWSQERSYLPSLKYGVLGKGWMTANNDIRLFQSGSNLKLNLSAAQYVLFTANGSGGYDPPVNVQMSIEQKTGTGEHYYLVTNQSTGETLSLYDFTTSNAAILRGRLKEASTVSWTAQGQTGITFSYDSVSGHLTSVATSGSQLYAIYFAYTAAERLESITVKEGASTLKTVTYTYQEDVASPAADIGAVANLVQVHVSYLDSNGDPVDRYTQYRYDSANRLKGVFSNTAIKRLLTSGDANVNTPTKIMQRGDSYSVNSASALENYASKWFTYYAANADTTSIKTPWSSTNKNLESEYAFGAAGRDETGFAKTERIGGTGCTSCGGGGGITKHYYYLQLSQGTPDDNEVTTITIEDTEDNAGNAAYRKVWGLNAQGKKLRYVFIDNPYSSPKYWCSSWKLTETSVYTTSGKSQRRSLVTEFRPASAHADAGSVSDFIKKFLDPYDDGSGGWANDSATLRTASDSPGPTTTYEYNDAGSMTEQCLKRGRDASTAYFVAAYDFGDGSTYPTTFVTATWAFPTKTPTKSDGVPTQYDYTFWDPSTKAQVKMIRVTAPKVLPAQNGSGVESKTETYYDRAGRLRWMKNAEGYVTYQSYDVETGQASYSAADVDTSNLPNSLPASASQSGASWLTPSADGASEAGAFPTRSVTSSYGTASTALGLVTTIKYDDMGRYLESVSPDGSRSSMLYEKLSPGGWRTTTFNHLNSSGIPQLPSSVVLKNTLGQVTDVISLKGGYSALAVTSGTPTGYTSSTGPGQSDYVAWTRYFYDETGRLVKTLVYHDIPTASGSSVVDGNPFDNYYVTASHYDEFGRVDQSYQLIDKDGSGYQEQITAYTFDTLSRTTAVQRVVSGTGHALGLDLTASSALGTITLPTSPGLTTVSTMIYDGGGVGDGRVTSSRQYHTSSTYTDVTNYYTFRGFLRGAKRTYGSGATAIGPYSIRDVDWLGRTDDSAVYTTVSSGDWTSLTAGDGDDDYVASNSTYRHSRVTVAYDKVGRPYQTDRYLGQKDWKERSFTFYDRLNRVVGAGSPYGVSQETAYDGAGRAYQTRTVTKLVDDSGSFGKYDSNGAFKYRGPSPHPSLSTMAGGTQDNGVVEMAHTVFDTTSRQAIEQHRFEMVHTESGSTLGIDLANYDDFVRRTVYRWYDANTDQLTAMADYGAGGTGATGTWKYNAIPTRTSSAPSTSGDAQVVTYGYDPATGRQQTVTAPGPGSTTVTTKTWYDKLGRVLHVAENYVDFNGSTGQGGGTNNDQDRVVSRNYNALGQTKTLTAYNPSGASTNPQTTTYSYLDAYDAALLTHTVYPDSTSTPSSGTDLVKVDYNLDGSRAQMTDQRGVVHQYEYDSARRLSFDKATTIPSPVYGSGSDSDAVRAIGFAYNDLGQPQSITSYSNTSATTVLNSVYYYYSTSSGNETDALEQIFQHHDSSTGASGPRVYFDRDYAVDGSNVLRNAARVVFMQYPGGQSANFNYNSHWTSTSGWSTDGNDDGLNDRLSRLGGITFTTSTTPFSGDFRVASYAYNGTGRLVLTDYVDSPSSHNGPKVKREMFNASSVNDYDAFDRFGRTLRSQWSNYSSGTTAIDKVEYTYDSAGNRLSRNVAAGSNDVYDYV